MRPVGGTRTCLTAPEKRRTMDGDQRGGIAMGRPVLSLIAALAVSAPAHAAELTMFVVNGWTGSSHCDDQSGKFSQCTAYGSYEGGVSLVVSVDRNRQWSLGFGHPQWNMGRPSVSLSYSFDNGSWVNGSGSVRNPRFVTLDVPDGQKLEDFLRRGQSMEVQINGEEYYFELADSPAVVAKLADCVQSQTKLEASSPDYSCVRETHCPLLDRQQTQRSYRLGQLSALSP